MQRKPNRLVIWLAGLAVLALVLTDVLTMFAEAREMVTPPAAITAQAESGPMLVAQADQAPPRKKRRTLMDLLFGDPQEQQQQAPVVEKPVVKPKKADLPPAKPKIEKAAGATRLAVFGDSMATDVGLALERLYADDPNLAVIVQGVGSSSFVRPDFFDWPKTIDQQIAANTFDIAVFIIGINDRQKMRLNDQSYGSLTPEWTTEYSARVSNVVRALSGNQLRMRKDDGIHFSAAGADKLAFHVSQSLRNYYRGGGAVGIEVADPLLGTDAQLMLRPPYQGLGQMKLLEVAGAVIPLTNATRRAVDLVTADTADAVPAGFDLTQMLEAPVGRADAFGVGKVENPAGP